MWGNISQILLLYKMLWYYNKFDSTKSLGVSYWCVEIPQYKYMEHGLKHITFYVQKYIAALAMCYNPGLVRDKPLGAPASVKLIYYVLQNTFCSYFTEHYWLGISICLTHWSIVMLFVINDHNYRWFRQRLSACLAPMPQSYPEPMMTTVKPLI